MTDKQKLESVASKLRFPATLVESKKIDLFNELISITPECSARYFVKFLHMLVDEHKELFTSLAELPHDIEAAKRFIVYEKMTTHPKVAPKLKVFARAFDKLVNIYDRSI
jgi:hypothetical protein